MLSAHASAVPEGRSLESWGLRLVFTLGSCRVYWALDVGSTQGRISSLWIHCEGCLSGFVSTSAYYLVSMERARRRRRQNTYNATEPLEHRHSENVRLLHFIGHHVNGTPR